MTNVIQRFAIYVLIALGLVALGFHFGARAESAKHAAGDAKAASAQVAAISTSVTAQAARQQQQLTDAQNASIVLATEQQRSRSAGVDIRLEIADAQFTVTGLDAGCADPMRTDEFVRLYNAASRGNPEAARSTRPR